MEWTGRGTGDMKGSARRLGVHDLRKAQSINIALQTHQSRWPSASITSDHVSLFDPGPEVDDSIFDPDWKIDRRPGVHNPHAFSANINRPEYSQDSARAARVRVA